LNRADPPSAPIRVVISSPSELTCPHAATIDTNDNIPIFQIFMASISSVSSPFQPSPMPNVAT
jgi:hypothetical protein